MRKSIVLAGAVAIAAAAGALSAGLFGPSSWFGPDDKFAQCRETTVGGADIGGPFELVDETGQTVTEKDVITGPTLVYFGYTFCPDICPTDNMRNAMAVEILDERGLDVKPVFISIDPERDTPERLTDFTDAFHDRMVGLTGTPAQVRQRFGLVQHLPLRFVYGDPPRLAEEERDRLYEWTRGTGRVNVNSATRAEIRATVNRAGHAEDILTVERLGLLEGSIVCAEGTDPPGLLASIGGYLRSELLAVVP